MSRADKPRERAEGRTARWPWLVAGAALVTAGLVGGAWLANRGPGPIPQLVYDTGDEGEPVARIDRQRLVEWCRAQDLPDPPSLDAAEPAVAEALLEALRRAAEERTGVAYGEVGKIAGSLDAHGTAAAYFRLAAAADPANFLWPYFLGCVHQEAGDQELAIEALELAMESNPEYPVTYARLGQLYLDTGRMDESRTMFESYATAAPNDWLGPVGLGRLALERGDPEEALEHLEAAAAIRSEDFQVQYNLGRAHAALGDRDTARRHFDRAAELPQGGWFLARDPLAQDLQRSGRSTASLMAEFERLSETGDWPTLASLAEEVVRRRPNDTTMLANLAKIYRAQKRHDEAREVVDRGLAQRPDSILLRAVLAEVLLAQTRYEEALAAADATLELDPTSPSGLVVRGRALYQLGRHAEAEVTLREYTRLAPDDVVSLYLLGESLLAQGKRDEAIAVLNEVLERQPGFRHAIARLALLRQQEENR